MLLALSVLFFCFFLVDLSVLAAGDAYFIVDADAARSFNSDGEEVVEG